MSVVTGEPQSPSGLSSSEACQETLHATNPNQGHFEPIPQIPQRLHRVSMAKRFPPLAFVICQMQHALQPAVEPFEKLNLKSKINSLGFVFVLFIVIRKVFEGNRHGQI